MAYDSKNADFIFEPNPKINIDNVDQSDFQKNWKRNQYRSYTVIYNISCNFMPSWITSNYLWEPPIYVIEPRNLSTFMEINWAFQSVSWEQFHWYIDKNNKHIHFQKLFLEFHFIAYFHFFPIIAEIFWLKWLLVSGNTYHFQWNFLEK